MSPRMHSNDRARRPIGAGGTPALRSGARGTRMDFELPPDLADLRDRVAAFIRDEVIPAEPHPDVDALRAKARAAGIFGPQLPPEWGGLGLGTVGMCVV